MPNENFTGEIVSLALLSRKDGAVRDLEFVDCQINGPVVIVGSGSEFTNCQWDDASAGIEALLWEITPNRPTIVGAVLVDRCRFIDCRFSRVGIAGPPDVIAMWRDSLAP